MTTRRQFLGLTATAAAGLVVGAAALEAYERLTWRKRVWAYPTNPAEARWTGWYHPQHGCPRPWTALFDGLRARQVDWQPSRHLLPSEPWSVVAPSGMFGMSSMVYSEVIVPDRITFSRGVRTVGDLRYRASVATFGTFAGRG